MEYIKKSEMTESSLENWCKKFETLEQKELSKDQAELFMKVLLSCDKLDSDPGFDEACKKDQVVQCIIKRSKACYDYELTNTAAVLLANWSNGSPGNFVMFITYLQYYCFTHDIWKIDVHELVNIFPWGIPSQDDMSKAWSWQKCQAAPDNLVDHLECAKSMRRNSKG